MPSRRRWSATKWLAAALVAGWAALAVVLVLRLDGRSIDDFFITYRYAEQLSRGEGFVFNPGERVFGTTAPGHGLLLAALHLATGVSIPLLGTATTGVALVALAALLAWSFRRRRAPEALFAGSWLLACTYVWNYHGGEAPVALALLAAAGLGCVARPALAGALLGFAVWCRPEVALAAAVLVLLRWWEERRPPWRLAIPLAATVALGVGLAWWWFGSPVPNTLGAKQVQSISALGTWRGGWSFWPDGFRHLSRRYVGPLTGLLVAAGLAGAVPLWRAGDRTSRPLVALGVGLLLAYPILGVPFAGWYAIPTVVVLIYGTVFIAGAAGRALGRRVGRPKVVAFLVAAVLLAPLAAVLGPRTARAFEHYRVYSVRSTLYRDAALWIRDHSAADDDISYVEIGTIGYWSERPVRDLLGLVDPGKLDNVARGDLAASLRAEPARFMLYHNRLASLLEPIRQSSWFQERYVEAATFRQGGEELIIYLRGAASRVTLVVEAEASAGAPQRFTVGDDGVDHHAEIRLDGSLPTWRRDPDDPCFEPGTAPAPPRAWLKPAADVAVTACRWLTSWGDAERPCAPGGPLLLDLDPGAKQPGGCDASATPHAPALGTQWVEGWAEIDGTWHRRRLWLFLRPPPGAGPDPFRLRVRAKAPEGALSVTDLLDEAAVTVPVAVDDSTIPAARRFADPRRDGCDAVEDKDDWVSLTFHPGADGTPTGCRYGFGGALRDCSPQQVDRYLLGGEPLLLDLDGRAAADRCHTGVAPGALPVGEATSLEIDLRLVGADGTERWTERRVRFEKRPLLPLSEPQPATLSLRFRDRTRMVRQRTLTPGERLQGPIDVALGPGSRPGEDDCPELRDRSDWVTLEVVQRPAARITHCRWQGLGDAALRACPVELAAALDERRPFALLHSPHRRPGESVCRPATFEQLPADSAGAIRLLLRLDGTELDWSVPLRRDD